MINPGCPLRRNRHSWSNQQTLRDSLVCSQELTLSSTAGIGDERHEYAHPADERL